MHRKSIAAAIVLSVSLSSACLKSPDDNNHGSDTGISDTGLSDTGMDASTSPDTGGGQDLAAPDMAPDTAPTPDMAPDAALPCDNSCTAPQVCDEVTNACVDCVGDADCALGVCDTSANTCVDCLSSADCGDLVCDTDLHACVGCVSTADCMTGVCDTGTSMCVECLATADCATGVCDTMDNSCVECLTTADCATGVCDTGTNSCVACLDDSTCLLASAPSCNAGTNLCEACQASADCAHLTDTRVCRTTDNLCVACDANDDTACGANACNPRMNTCTNTPKGSVGLCGACETDSECLPDSYCMVMSFSGSVRHNGLSGYCLPRYTAANGCPWTTSSGIAEQNRMSIDNFGPIAICSINQTNTTCEAVLSYGTQCTTAMDCGAESGDATCGRIGGSLPTRCTYECSFDGDCEDGVGCGPTYCGIF